ncbi:MAG: alpha/beta hydrolase [Hyphomicrobiales bacterium]|nr:MAG: alpha/beta hydrolase [Hyphomicrobiales bacterium]
MIDIDPAVFRPSSISEETSRFNADLLARITALPDPWQYQPSAAREARARGRGPFPVPRKSPRAEVRTIDGPAGDIPIRVIRPEGRDCRGAYLHIHGGGWVLGSAYFQDDRLEQIADDCGLAAVSVDYRLAPEDPYPAGPDDCEAAALWLVDNLEKEFGGSFLAIGGESAGAHLSVVTLLRLRDRRGITPFSAANLVAGCYDLAMTPSVRHWGADRLVLNTRDIDMFVTHFLSGGVGSVSDPDVSPLLHADLYGLPPALFSVGTLDPLVDDSLFMAGRWARAGLKTELALFAGGCHVFQAFDELAITRESLARMDAFLNAQIEKAE